MTMTAKWPINRLGESGARALELSAEFRTELEPRLAAGLLDGLSADLGTFDAKRSAAARGGATLVAATRSQNEAARAAHALVVAVREGVRRAQAKPSEKKDFGVGNLVRADSVPLVLAGLDDLIAGAAKLPDVARKAGLLGADLDKARGLRVALSGADLAQGGTRERRKSTTSDRTAAQRRIESAIDTIVGVAAIAFQDRPAIAARFAALVPGRATGKATPAPKPA